MADIYYALGLHMHQPPENLKLLIDHNEWEAQQIIRCYERAARYARLYKDVGAFHVGFSGVLLEQLQNPDIIDAYRKFVDIPKMLAEYRGAKNIEIIGMGFYHPIFPLIPREDWAEQLKRGRGIIRKLFNQNPKGFWPSEMAFCMEMIPALREAGYEYVIVDHVHVAPLKKSQKADCFTPYTARFEDAEITVIPRNRDISNAQESGMDAGWFLGEVRQKITEYPSALARRLVTTWSDGENGGWFRQMDERAGFFGHFFGPLMELIREGKTELKPIMIKDFLKKYHPAEGAIVRTGAWNIASTSGYDFSQWAGSDSQRRAIEALCMISRKYWEVSRELLQEEKALRRLSSTARECTKKAAPNEERLKRMEQARELILNAETSCYLFWGDAWIPKIYDKLNAAQELLR